MILRANWFTMNNITKLNFHLSTGHWLQVNDPSLNRDMFILWNNWKWSVHDDQSFPHTYCAFREWFQSLSKSSGFPPYYDARMPLFLSAFAAFYLPIGKENVHLSMIEFWNFSDLLACVHCSNVIIHVKLCALLDAVERLTHQPNTHAHLN